MSHFFPPFSGKQPSVPLVAMCVIAVQQCDGEPVMKSVLFLAAAFHLEGCAGLQKVKNVAERWIDLIFPSFFFFFL